MSFLKRKPALSIVWSKEQDPSPEFFQWAELGRRRKTRLPVSTDLKVLSREAGNKGDRPSSSTPTRGRSPRFPDVRSWGQWLLAGLIALMVLVVVYEMN